MPRQNDINERKNERVKKMLETKRRNKALRNKEIKLQKDTQEPNIKYTENTQESHIEYTEDTIDQNNNTFILLETLRRFSPQVY